MKQLDEFDEILRGLEHGAYWGPGLLGERLQQIKRLGAELQDEIQNFKARYCDLAERGMALGEELEGVPLSMEQQEQVVVLTELNEIFDRLYHIVYEKTTEFE